MPQRWQDVKAWRDRAEKLRRTADNFTLPSATNGLLDAARKYERMADDLERKLKLEGVTPASA
jgi:hypothetical protein